MRETLARARYLHGEFQLSRGNVFSAPSSSSAPKRQCVNKRLLKRIRPSLQSIVACLLRLQLSVRMAAVWHTKTSGGHKSAPAPNECATRRAASLLIFAPPTPPLGQLASANKNGARRSRPTGERAGGQAERDRSISVLTKGSSRRFVCRAHIPRRSRTESVRE